MTRVDSPPTGAYQTARLDELIAQLGYPPLNWNASPGATWSALARAASASESTDLASWSHMRYSALNRERCSRSAEFVPPADDSAIQTEVVRWRAITLVVK